MGKEGELWHLVEAKREDDSPTIFRIRELSPRLDQPRIFVAELPYPVADGSRLPDAPSYRRFATFEEQWLDPACSALDWTPVAVKIEDGSFFIYLYGADDPRALIERLSPFDSALGFFDESDPTWDEYMALRELLEEAKTMAPADEAPLSQIDDDLTAAAHTKTSTRTRRPTKTMKSAGAAKSKPKPAAKSKSVAKSKSAAKSKSKPKPAAKSKPKPAAKSKSKPKRAAKSKSATAKRR